MSDKNDGGPAFARPHSIDPDADWPLGIRRAQPGMSLRDYYAATAPVDYHTAAQVFGSAIPADDQGRAAFFAVWTLLRHEYADAMLEAREQRR